MSRKFIPGKSDDNRRAKFSDRPAAMQPNLPILTLESGRADLNDLVIKNYFDGIYTLCVRDFGELAEVFATGTYPDIKLKERSNRTQRFE